MINMINKKQKNKIVKVESSLQSSVIQTSIENKIHFIRVTI